MSPADRGHPSRGVRRARGDGFTLVELVLTLAVISVLAAIAVPSYADYVRNSRIAAATGDLGRIQAEISMFRLNNGGQDPPDLGAVGMQNLRDPWGQPYVYLRLAGKKTIGKARKNKSLVPINSDYDLYSVGADGRSASPLTAALSRDDIIRANDGGFIGLASRY